MGSIVVDPHPAVKYFTKAMTNTVVKQLSLYLTAAGQWNTLGTMQAQRERLLRIRENRNLARVYAEIRHRGPLPKSRIGLDLPVSKPTRYGLMSALLTGGLLVEDAESKAMRPSRSTLLDIRADLFHTIGIDIHLAGIDFLIMDLKCRQTDALFIPNRVDDAHNQSLDDRQVVLTRIQDGLRQVMDRSGLDAAAR